MSMLSDGVNVVARLVAETPHQPAKEEAAKAENDQQNGVTERQIAKLFKAARVLLISLATTTMWYLYHHQPKLLLSKIPNADAPW